MIHYLDSPHPTLIVTILVTCVLAILSRRPFNVDPAMHSLAYSEKSRGVEDKATRFEFQLHSVRHLAKGHLQIVDPCLPNIAGVIRAHFPVRWIAVWRLKLQVLWPQSLDTTGQIVCKCGMLSCFLEAEFLPFHGRLNIKVHWSFGFSHSYSCSALNNDSNSISRVLPCDEIIAQRNFYNAILTRLAPGDCIIVRSRGINLKMANDLKIIVRDHPN